MLFTDLFLIAKRSKEKLNIIKAPIRLDLLLYWRLSDNDRLLVAQLNEYKVIAATYEFSGDIDTWVDIIEKTRVGQLIYRL